MELSQYQEFIHMSRYARWNGERRETWAETCQRYIDYFERKTGLQLDELQQAIYEHEVFPSMRALMSAGPALARDEVAGYNCAYMPLLDTRAFAELLFILCCGTGVGFSVEQRYVEQLPTVQPLTGQINWLSVADSKEGWATALHELLENLYAGHRVIWDTSAVRPAGALLQTMGGRASGPEPLEELFRYCVNVFNKAQGRKLTSLEVHDIACKIADIVVVGGVRRSATISFSDLDDDALRTAKSGDWWVDAPHRRLANNSVVYTERPARAAFDREWAELVNGGSGERGTFSLPAVQQTFERIGRAYTDEIRSNPCNEILLRPWQFCNLSTAVVRSTDDAATLERKVRLAARLGTMQSDMLNFRFLRPEWRANGESERLLGVSLTGIKENPLLCDPDPALLERLQQAAVDENRVWAAKLGINPSAAVTCIKPEGTTSQFANTSSGGHRRFAPYYIRRVRQAASDPLTQFMQQAGVPWEQDRMSPETVVFEFPVDGSSSLQFEGEGSALQQLEDIMLYADYYCQHKPSATVYVRDDEWQAVGDWVYENIERAAGLAFFPFDENTYPQAPYEEISADEYVERALSMPVLDWTKLQEFEQESNVQLSQEFACAGGACEL